MSQLITNAGPLELGKSGDPAAVPLLISYLKSQTPNERRLAASAIRKLAYKHRQICNSAVDALIPLILDLKHHQVRRYALSALAMLDVPAKHLDTIKEISRNDCKTYNRKLASTILKAYEKSQKHLLSEDRTLRASARYIIPVSRRTAARDTSMLVPEEHTALIRRTGFPVPANAGLNSRDQQLLERYGFWLEGLASGILHPITAEQQRFIKVALGKAEPVSVFESIWVKYRSAIEPSSVDSARFNLTDLMSRLRAARNAAAAVRAGYNARQAAIQEQVRPQLEALETEFADQITAADGQSAQVEAEVRAAILAYGRSFRHAGVLASYIRGRVIWDSKSLAHYEQSHPEISRFRRMGSPSVRLRFDPQPEEMPSGEDGKAHHTVHVDTDSREYFSTLDDRIENDDDDDLGEAADARFGQSIDQDDPDDDWDDQDDYGYPERTLFLELGLDPDDPDYLDLAPHGMRCDGADDEDVEEFGSLVEDYLDREDLEDEYEFDEEEE